MDIVEHEVVAVVEVVEHMVKAMEVARLGRETMSQENPNPIKDPIGWGRMANHHNAITASQFTII